ncbi:MAG: UvrD-helicase domain-containing protein [Pseudomonadales bacterium]
MIKIQVSGAGAGKTHCLAQSILDRLADRADSHKLIHALTFTNAARNKITDELLKNHGKIPEAVVVQTVHSYLLNELVFPFSPYVQGVSYTRASTTPLSDKYKASEIKRLRDLHIAHVDGVYSAARRVVDRTLSTLNASQKRRVDRVLEIICASTEMIFIDETQDLDVVALSVFEALGLKALDVYMVGDPKQAIRYPSAFSNFIEKHKNAGNVETLPFNNVSRRVPMGILSLSNRFCSPDQVQTSISSKLGALKFIESTDPKYDEFILACKEQGGIVCIEMKTGRYATSSHRQDMFHPDIEELIRENCGELDSDIYIDSEKMILDRQVMARGKSKAVSGFMKRHGIQYSAQVYGKIMQNIDEHDEADFVVSSIDAVKGLEAGVCVLIISPNTYKYLTQSNLTKENRHNKVWNKLYVAITRAKSEFVVAFDHELFQEFEVSIGEIRGKLVGLGFKEHTSQNG